MNRFALNLRVQFGSHFHQRYKFYVSLEFISICRTKIDLVRMFNANGRANRFNL